MRRPPAYLIPRVLSAIMLEDHHQGPYDLLLQTSDVTSVSFQDRPLPILKFHPSIHPSRDRKHHFNSYDYPSILSIKNTSDEKPLPAKQYRYRPLEARIILSKSTRQTKATITTTSQSHSNNGILRSIPLPPHLTPHLRNLLPPNPLYHPPPPPHRLQPRLPNLSLLPNLDRRYLRRSIRTTLRLDENKRERMVLLHRHR